ncbi:MAG: DUF418 domain-containing protein [Cyclobacteriaceae bacterium]|nr:DUF418 domain-containing protein [Cyclobacteriaceae bacterium]
MSLTAQPTLQHERADILDILRGFALLGVLLDNLYGFTGYGFFSPAQREALSTYYPDIALALSEIAFIHGKFYSLFSILFGIGFSIILIRNEQRGINPLLIFYKRLGILALIGLAHLLLLWEGDILLLYAVVGFSLPLFRKCTDKTVLIWALALILSPILIDIVKVLLDVKPGAFLEVLAQGIDSRNGLPTDESFSKYLYKEGSGWTEWRNWQQSGLYYRYAYIIESNRIPKVLGLFLLGFYIGRKMMYANLHQHVELLINIRKWGFIVGIPLSIGMAIFEIDGKAIPNPLGLIDTVLYALSVVPLSLAIAASICLYWLKTKGNTRWNKLAPVGRMALTNYLMQTGFGILIFYGVGFGFGGNIGPTFYFPIGLGIYVFQILYSNWWFKYFHFGPMEWIWRQLTYGKTLRLRKNHKT